MSNKTSLNDPRTLYPGPPFPDQPQQAPGLARKMDPTPDHGEERYRGLGKLTGRKALVTGGDSGIGRAAAIAFAREGADVAIAYLPDEEADAKEVIGLIEAEGRKAVALPGDIKEEPWCRQLVDEAVSGLGGLDILVINAGRQQYREKIEDLSTEDFDKTMKTNLYAVAISLVASGHPLHRAAFALGPMRFLSTETRSEEQALLGADLLALMDSRSIEKALLIGYDWGGRGACIRPTICHSISARH
jgi:hypothetical protein